MSDNPETNGAAPADAVAPAPVLTFVKRADAFANLAVGLDDGSAMPDEGAEVLASAEPWASMLERAILVVAPAREKA